MQAVKGVEVGWAEEGSKSYGSKVQDTIHYDKGARRFSAATTAPEASKEA